jgi:hypothetical protein
LHGKQHQAWIIFTDSSIETREIGGHVMFWLLARQRPSMIASDRSQ